MAPLRCAGARSGHRRPQPAVLEFVSPGPARARYRARRGQPSPAPQTPAYARRDGDRGRPAAARPRRTALGFAAQTVRRESVEILAPTLFMLGAELVKVIPRINPGVVQIVKFDPDSVIADRFEPHNADMTAA